MLSKLRVDRNMTCHSLLHGDHSQCVQIVLQEPSVQDVVEQEPLDLAADRRSDQKVLSLFKAGGIENLLFDPHPFVVELGRAIVGVAPFLMIHVAARL